MKKISNNEYPISNFQRKSRRDEILVELRVPRNACRLIEMLPLMGSYRREMARLGNVLYNRQ